MLFSQRLSSEVYEPWKEHYLAYDSLKKLLKEGAAQSKWTEEDESRFVEMLDKELDKVYGFETAKFNEISDSLNTVESEVNSLKVTDPKKLDSVMEQILDDATHIDRFRRLNYTGFTKLVRKHDRLHPEYHVMPLLQSRFTSLPFHTEDYSPLLRRLGKIYTDMDQNSDGTGSALARSHMMNSVNEQKFHSNGYVTLQFWVHPDNLMEVKTRVLRRLPVLVYDREDEDESERDPIVTSLYLDNNDFKLYKSTLERDSDTSQDIPSGSSLRFRWYGPLSEKPEIVLEQHNEVDGHITRINIKEKSINKFLSGDDSVIKKQCRKMRERHSHSKAIEDYEVAASELMAFVTKNHLEPVLRTVYKRTAFEIPGDNRVRVILDQNILFTREDSFNKELPIRDPSNWHRADLDQPGIDPASLLRKGEFARFPYSVLEVRLKSDSNNGVEKLPWIDELRNSNLIKEIPHFTKFVQGVSVLFGENDHLDILPFWLSELDAARSSNEPETNPLLSTNSGTTSSSSGHPAPGPSGSRMALKAKDYKFDDEDEDEFDSEDSGLLDEVIDGDAEIEDSQGDYIGFPTRVGKFSDGESEDDEVDLPPGVEQPSQWIKNQSSPKVEAKVWLANERTFNKWLHITCLLSALTFTLYSSVSKATSPRIATIVSYVLFSLSIFSGLWGYTQYQLRIKYIKERGDKPMDAPFGPIVVSIGLFLALVINFTATYKSKMGTDPNVPSDPKHPGKTTDAPGVSASVTTSTKGSGKKTKSKHKSTRTKDTVGIDAILDAENEAYNLI